MSNNLRKKALLPAIAMVLVSVIALSGVTYAWFTTSNTATVSSLDVNVQSANGIQISLNAVDWKSSLKGTDITTSGYANNKNQYPGEDAYISPVSTIGEIDANTGHMKMFYGELTDTDALQTSLLTDGENSNYIAFDLFFKINSDEEVISLEMADSKVKDTDENVNSACASRVAFINYGSAGASGTATDAQALKTPVENGVTIWEPNSLDCVDGTPRDSIATYQGVKATSTDAFTTAGALGTVSPAPVDLKLSGDSELFTLKKGINKVRVYIWMEGQDPDCTNDASGGAFSTILKFSRPADETTAA